MLRSSIAPGRQLLSNPVRQRIPSQWLSKAGASTRLAGQVGRPYTCFISAPTDKYNAQRFFADSKPPTTGGPTPASPSSESSVPPETILKAAEQGMTTPLHQPPLKPFPHVLMHQSCRIQASSFVSSSRAPQVRFFPPILDLPDPHLWLCLRW
jgi:hypothetical protein